MTGSRPGVERVSIYHPAIQTKDNRLDFGLRLGDSGAWIYELAPDAKTDNGGFRAADYLYQICEDVRQCYFGEQTLQNIAWTLRSGFTESSVRFRRLHDQGVLIRLSNALALDAEAGTLQQHKKAYFRENEGACFAPPPVPHSYIVMHGKEDDKTVYFDLQSQDSKHGEGYGVTLVDAAFYINLVRQHCPLDYARISQNMLLTSRTGGGTRLRKAMPVSTLYCRCGDGNFLEKLDIVDAAEGSLGFLDRGFSVLPVRVRRGAQRQALKAACPVITSPDDISRYGPRREQTDGMSMKGSQAKELSPVEQYLATRDGRPV